MTFFKQKIERVELLLSHKEYNEALKHLHGQMFGMDDNDMTNTNLEKVVSLIHTAVRLRDNTHLKLVK